MRLKIEQSLSDWYGYELAETTHKANYSPGASLCIACRSIVDTICEESREHLRLLAVLWETARTCVGVTSLLSSALFSSILLSTPEELLLRMFLSLSLSHSLSLGLSVCVCLRVCENVFVLFASVEVSD